MSGSEGLPRALADPFDVKWTHHRRCMRAITETYPVGAKPPIRLGSLVVKESTGRSPMRVVGIVQHPGHATQVAIQYSPRQRHADPDFEPPKYEWRGEDRVGLWTRSRERFAPPSLKAAALWPEAMVQADSTFRHVPETETQDAVNMAWNHLYQWKAHELDQVPQYGYKRGEDSRGDWIMEVADGTSLIAVAPARITRVMPHTVEAEDLETQNRGHYKIQPDLVAVGDLVVLGGRICRVTAVDTREETPRTVEGLYRLTAYRLET